jgi:hypothetical protein
VKVLLLDQAAESQSGKERKCEQKDAAELPMGCAHIGKSVAAPG